MCQDWSLSTKQVLTPGMYVLRDGNTLPLNDGYKGKDAATLLQQGWQPLRETPMRGQGNDCAALCSSWPEAASQTEVLRG